MYNFFLILTMAMYVVVLLYKFIKYKYSLLLRITPWFMLFYFFYFLYAALCVDSFNKDDKCFLSIESLNQAKFFVVFLGLIFLLFFTQLSFPELRSLEIGNPKRIIMIIAYVVVIIAFLLLLKSVKDLLFLFRSFGKEFNYLSYRGQLEQIRARSHLKIFVYSLLAIYYYVYLPTGKLKWLLRIDFILAFIFDVISGTRTSMFLIVLFLYVVTIRIKKRTYFPVMLVLCVLILFSSNLTRLIGLQKIDNSNLTFVDKFLAGNGEFNNTFITLPYVLEDKVFKTYDLVTFLSWGNFIPPLTRIFNEQSLGNIFQDSIGRGIGYGSNIISNWYYISNSFSILFITLFFIGIIYIDEKTNYGDFFALKILFICFVRNFCREGLTSFMTALYIFIVYFGFYILLNKKNGKFLCINFTH